MSTLQAALDFQLPAELAAREPPEARGLARDEVRLMVTRVGDNVITHTRFFHLPDFLHAGDVLVVNTSATISAALAGRREARDGGTSHVLLHLSAPLSGRRWVVELRSGLMPLLAADARERVHLPEGGTAILIEPYVTSAKGTRLWIAELTLPSSTLRYAAQHGSPIRYSYVPKAWPLSYYQTVFAAEPGSAEMPSAARAFTPAILHRLQPKGVRIAPVVLHTGVSSPDADEPPYPERYRVPAATAEAVNHARATGKRIIAVGTTAVRALETVAAPDGRVQAGSGWTDVVITPERGVHAVDAILTGFHEPTASHLSMLEALAGREHLELAYEAALRQRYLWHEFGDLHLILG
ncbi:MAG: S-adenosylmethionine:tRNA ribosyltransferase-isomerase [Gemmatimonadota bacterium]